MSGGHYTVASLAQALGAPLHGTADGIVEHLAIDSRKPLAAATTLFFALHGERHDGHRYIPELIARGVRAFVVRDLPLKEYLDQAAFIQVPDTLLALQHLAAWHRAHFNVPVIGITGSNGKTIVKEWLDQLLRDEEHIARSPGSWNSQVGVPLSVWGLSTQHTLGIFEAGISQRGEMQRLRPIIAPTIGVLTNIREAHSQGFASDLEKAIEKCTLFRSAGTLVCCLDEAAVAGAVEASLPHITLRDWSRTNDRAFVHVVAEERVANATRMGVMHGASPKQFLIPFTDAASVENAITCITVLLHLGKEEAWINARLAHLLPVEMRLRTMQGTQGTTLIDDSYSNDLSSLAIALDHQAQIAQGRERIVVLSDIAESGRPAALLYREVASLLQRAGITRLIGVGDAIGGQRASFPPGTRFHANTTELLEAEDPSLFSGAVVLIKGARSFHLERAVERWQHLVHGTVLEVDLDAVRHNLNHYRGLLRLPHHARTANQRDMKVMAMVKAFGYGSGAVELARLFAHERVDYLGVAYADEGIELRQHGIETPILVMNPEPVPFGTLHRFNLEAEVYDQRSLAAAVAYARSAPDAPPIHVKLDTGMHRLGFQPAELPDLLAALRSTPLRVASILSHLAASEDPQHDAFTQQQIDLFTSMALSIGEVLGYRPLWHIVNSGGITRSPNAHFDMVRLGIGLHGVGATEAETNHLLPTVALRTVVAQVKEIPAGDSVGYGRKAISRTARRIAILPLGYADGYSRRLGNGQGRVWIADHEARTVGNICMDMCMVDVTHVPCQAGDKVVVFDQQHTLAQYAADLGTIPYEALTSIAQRVKRVYAQG